MAGEVTSHAEFCQVFLCRLFKEVKGIALSICPSVSPQEKLNIGYYLFNIFFIRFKHYITNVRCRHQYVKFFRSRTCLLECCPFLASEGDTCVNCCSLPSLHYLIINNKNKTVFSSPEHKVLRVSYCDWSLFMI